MDKDLNVKPKIIKLLKGNTGQKLHNIGFCDAFLDMVSKTQMTKKRDKLDLMKILKFCTSKNTIPPPKKNATHRMGEDIWKLYIS